MHDAHSPSAPFPAASPGMVGSSTAMQSVLMKLRRIGPHFRTVLLRGERGTGHDLAAQTLHALGAGIHTTYLKYETAEHASHENPFHPERLFHAATGGTLFLDEISKLPLALQAQLIQAIRMQEARKLHALTPRLIASTSVDLKSYAASGYFRQDLYLRLSMIEIALPPLRERLEDIQELVEHFSAKAHREHALRSIPFSSEAIARLRRYHWPGNVRELEDVVLAATSRCATDVVNTENLPPLNAPPSETRTRLDDVVRQHVRAVLQECAGNKLRAAEMLGISRSTLYRMLEAENAASAAR